MKISIRRRMAFGILGSTLVVFVVIVLITYYYGRKEALDEVRTGVKNLTRLYAQKFQGKFLGCSRIPQMIALYLESHPDMRESDLKALMRRVVEEHPEIYGTCVAFEPFSFFPDRFYYAPYYYQREGKVRFVQLGNEEYNYYKREWYALPEATQRALWTEPYFDIGGGEVIMTTYSVPFLKGGEFWGIATVDISMEDLMKEVRQFKVGENGYAFILSREGAFVTFPDPSKVMTDGLQSYDPTVTAQMISGHEGIKPFVDPLSGEKTWIIFTPIPASGWSLAIVYPVDEVMEGVFALEKHILLIGGAGLVAIFLIIAFLARGITIPLRALVRTAMRAADGDLDQKLPQTRFHDEVWELSSALGKMMVDLKIHMEELRRTTAEKERIESELKIAREIQRSILPRTFPPFPGRKEFDIYASTIPAREVGGDFYDFFFVEEDTLGFVIADVSGKGVPAALFMAVSRTLMKATALRGQEPGESLREVNQLLLPGNESAMFVTLFYGTLDLSTGLVRYANGGHNIPYVCHREDGIEPLCGEGGIVLGVWPEARYKTNDIRLASGDRLFLYTDGVTEAENSASEFFTTARLEAYLSDQGSRSPQEMIIGLNRTLETFCEDAHRSDDITMLALQYHGKALMR